MGKINKWYFIYLSHNHTTSHYFILHKVIIQNSYHLFIWKGRNGKGSIYIWAAGNGGTADNCNADGYANSIYTVAITGVQIGKNAWYSEVCAPALAAAYGGSEDDRFMASLILCFGN